MKSTFSIEWLIYCDYWSANKNGLFSTKNFKTMERHNEQFNAPHRVRHGAVVEVPASTVKALNALNQD
jgi:hypothetical protein